MAVTPIPEGQHSVCPYLLVQDVPRLIEFLKATFDASLEESVAGPGGAVVHARVRIGDAHVMIGTARPDWPPMSAMVHIYISDSDAVYERALKAGAETVAPPTTHFYGDRSAGVKDFAGNMWWISTHVEDVSPEEMGRRMAAHGK